jgi:SAM-dependent methyltransferase
MILPPCMQRATAVTAALQLKHRPRAMVRIRPRLQRKPIPVTQTTSRKIPFAEGCISPPSKTVLDDPNKRRIFDVGCGDGLLPRLLPERGASVVGYDRAPEGYLPDRTWAELSRRIMDIADLRLTEMDRNGIAMMVLSLNAPAIQAIPDPRRADEVARRANDHLAAQIAKRPDRFAGLAALPMQAPDLAARELVRCVEDLNFRGALVNSFSQVGDPDIVVYYDLPQYRPFWATVERLDVPFYLHPRNPIPAWSQIYDGHARLHDQLGAPCRDATTRHSGVTR